MAPWLKTYFSGPATGHYPLQVTMLRQNTPFNATTGYVNEGMLNVAKEATSKSGKEGDKWQPA
jgi:hypothetical protein